MNPVWNTLIIIPISINYNNEFVLKDYYYYDRFSNDNYNLRSDCLKIVITLFQRLNLAKKLYLRVYGKVDNIESSKQSKIMKMCIPSLMIDDKLNLIKIVTELKSNIILKTSLANIFENEISLEICKCKFFSFKYFH